MNRRAFASILLSAAVASAAQPVLASVGTEAPEFTLPCAPGGPTRGRFRLTDSLHRKPIVVLFWATWCQPCLAEMGHLRRLYEKNKDRGFIILAIAMDSVT